MTIEYSRRKHLMIAGYIVFAALFCAMAASRFMTEWRRTPAIANVCVDRFGKHSRNASNADVFTRCLEANARVFIEFDYEETKDLSKAFLTLLTALLVASITFSEKIVDLKQSSWWSRGLMITCWVLILTAIGTAGSGLALMTGAARWAAHDPAISYFEFGAFASDLFVWAGLFFGSGLAALFAAGLISLVERRQASNVPGDADLA